MRKKKREADMLHEGNKPSRKRIPDGGGKRGACIFLEEMVEGHCFVFTIPKTPYDGNWGYCSDVPGLGLNRP